MTYICPMHSKVKQEKPGYCPECGMKLISENITKKNTRVSAKPIDSSYRTLLSIFILIFITSLITSWVSGLTLVRFIEHFMIGFFLIFSGFKLIDLPGFAQGYSTYDLLAQKVYSYGYIYPFIEFAFALLMILNFHLITLLWIEIVVMVFSGLGVAAKLAKNERFQCACLGTFLKVPLTKVTLIEDFGMAFLAFILIIIH